MAIIKDNETGKHFNVAAEARRLGVSKQHLSLVLRGKRVSKSLSEKVHIKIAK